MARRPDLWRRVYRTFPDYEWDEAKSEEVFQRRGFDLEFASQVFPGAVLEREDTRGYGEARWQVIGEVMGEVLFVVYTIRAGACRIITARDAEPHERDFWDRAGQ